MKDLKATYDGVEIVYSETNDRWEFTLRGRERFAQSLTKAKEAIDKPVKESGKEFEPVKAIFRNYSGDGKPGTITSIAESGYRSQQVWFVMDEDKRRSKQSLSNMCEHSEKNLGLLAEAKALDKEGETLRKKAEHKRDQMTALKLAIPE